MPIKATLLQVTNLLEKILDKNNLAGLYNGTPVGKPDDLHSAYAYWEA